DQEAAPAGPSGAAAADGGDTVRQAETGTQAAPGESTPQEEPAREANLVGYGPSAGATARRARKSASAPAAAAPQVPAPQEAPALQEAAPTPQEPAAPSGAKPLAKPPVRKYAKDQGVDLSAITPTR